MTRERFAALLVLGLSALGSWIWGMQHTFWFDGPKYPFPFLPEMPILFSPLMVFLGWWGGPYAIGFAIATAAWCSDRWTQLPTESDRRRLRRQQRLVDLQKEIADLERRVGVR